MDIQKSVLEQQTRITVTVEVDKAKYEQFRKIFDEQSWKDFVNYCVNSGHLDEVLGDNPELMAAFLKAQTERQAREAKQTEVKPEILFTLTGEQARRHIEDGDTLSATVYTKEEDGEDRIEFYLTG
jgi:hypothetical protein